MPSAFSPARTVVFRLHWALGLTAGLVLALMGLTGALMSYEEAITAFANRDRIQVSAAQDRPPLTPSALAARIEAQLPGQRVSALTLSGDPAQSAVARFARDRAGGRPSPVYADPTEGTVLGPVRLEAFFATVRELHRWLLLPGEGKGWGRTITGACAIALLVFLGSGLYLRWPGRHRWRVWLRPNLARPGRARWWSLHAVAGTWLLPVYAVSALSGLWWSYDWYRAGATWLLTGQALPARAVERAPGGKPPDSKIPEGKIPEGTSAIDTAWAEFSATHTASSRRCPCRGRRRRRSASAGTPRIRTCATRPPTTPAPAPGSPTSAPPTRPSARGWPTTCWRYIAGASSARPSPCCSAS